jgi:hypothetical protein
MSRSPRLSDAVLRAALTPAIDAAGTSALLQSIAADVRRTPQSRPLLRIPRPALPRLDTPNRRLIMLGLAAAALLTALAGSAFIGARLQAPTIQPSVRLVPSSVVETLSTRIDASRVLVDGKGTYWAEGRGRVIRFDPDSGRHEAWTVGDDARFEGSIAGAARDGGVWLVADGLLQRFDGTGFPEAIPWPFTAAYGELVENADGTAWAASPDDGVARWDGATWSPEAAGRPVTGAQHLLVARDGTVWVANYTEPVLAAEGVYQRVADGSLLDEGVSHLVDGRWETYGRSASPGLWGMVGGIAEAADGSIWVTTEAASTTTGIARFDGRTWSLVDGPGFWPWSLAADADGAVWAVTGEPGKLDVARYRDGTWARYGAADGLAGAGIDAISATRSGVFAGTNLGLFRFADGRWTPAWSEPVAGPGGGGRIVAISATEAWTADGDAAWHWRDGGWERFPLPTAFDAASGIRDLAVGPDGTVWTATEKGLLVLADGTWSVAWDHPAGVVDVAADGTAWAAGRGDALLAHVTRDRGGFDVTTAASPVAITALAAARDGTVYAGNFGYTTIAGLARCDATSCTQIHPLGAADRVAVLDLVAHPGGGVVAVLFGDGPGPTWDSWLVRVDGDTVDVLERRGKVDGYSGNLAVSPDGDIWRTRWTGGGIERLHEGTWGTVVDVGGGPLAVARDGTLWFTGGAGVLRLRPTTGGN